MPPSRKGIKHKLETIEKIRHGVPMFCDRCGSMTNIEWSNISGNYSRDRVDWQRLCSKHHKEYDKKMPGMIKRFYKKYYAKQ